MSTLFWVVVMVGGGILLFAWIGMNDQADIRKRKLRRIQKRLRQIEETKSQERSDDE
jgi:hypothetical protein